MNQRNPSFASSQPNASMNGSSTITPTFAISPIHFASMPGPEAAGERVIRMG